jgi:hypothetical protein
LRGLARERPHWIAYQFTKSDFAQDSGLSEQQRDELAGQSQVLSLSSGIDGTLTISLKSGSVNVYSTELTIDVKASKIRLSALQRLGSEPVQIQKMVIPCWSVYDNLRKTLAEDKPTGSLRRRTGI